MKHAPEAAGGAAIETPPGQPGDVLVGFWRIPPASRTEALLPAILHAHAWHYARNPAYRRTVAARGVSEQASQADLPRLLRPTAQTFKQYIDLLETPFPQDEPRRFVDWLADQLSIRLPRERAAQLRARYPSLEALLSDIERVYADFDLEMLTSSGTSGRATILARDAEAIRRTVRSFYLSFQRYFGMQVDHRAIFIMPQQTRIAMARMVAFSLRQIDLEGFGLPAERIHFTIPFPAYPDQVRIRAGRTFRPGLQGWVERRVGHPFMNWMNEHYASPRAVKDALTLLQLSEEQGDKALLFASWVHLHGIALALKKTHRRLRLPPGSLLGTGGGFKELYPYSIDQIRADLAQTVVLTTGEPAPVRDVYGMAEANWAAMQCQYGNYHIPPWVAAAALDADDQLQTAPQAEGMLAFFDPLGGGLFPAFFKTADHVRLMNGMFGYDPALDCPCGEQGAYLAAGSIRRVDLIDEAGCAAQV